MPGRNHADPDRYGEEYEGREDEANRTHEMRESPAEERMERAGRHMKRYADKARAKRGSSPRSYAR